MRSTEHTECTEERRRSPWRERGRYEPGGLTRLVGVPAPQGEANRERDDCDKKGAAEQVAGVESLFRADRERSVGVETQRLEADRAGRPRIVRGEQHAD